MLDVHTTKNFVFFNELKLKSLPVTIEAGFSKWTINNPDNGVTWEHVTVAGNSPGDKAMRLNHFNYNSVGQIDELISPILNFSGDTLIEFTITSLIK